MVIDMVKILLIGLILTSLIGGGVVGISMMGDDYGMMQDGYMHDNHHRHGEGHMNEECEEYMDEHCEYENYEDCEAYSEECEEHFEEDCDHHNNYKG